MARKDKDKYGFAKHLDILVTRSGYWARIDDVIVEPANNGRFVVGDYKPPQHEGESDEDWRGRWRPSNFEVSDVDDLLDASDLGSLVNQGQADACKAWVDGNGIPHLHIGFRRHFALTVARDQGIEIPAPKGKEGRICFIKVDAPKTEADQLRLMATNIAENVMRRGLSPLDLMTVLVRYTASTAEGGFGLTRKDAAERLGISLSAANKHIRVSGMSPKLRREWYPKLHRGDATIQAACAAMKDAGEGGTRQQTGVRKAAVKRAFKHVAARPAPKVDLVDAEIELLVACLFGESDIDAKDDAGAPRMPESVRAWYRWADASKADVATPDPSKGPNGRKAPPKAGATKEDG